MDLLDLCSLRGTSPPSGGSVPPGGSVPAWTLGCFRRRSITFFNGDMDDSTLVIWLQARGVTCDLRLAADRPKPPSRQAVAELTRDELRRLLEVEGGISPTRFEASGVGGVELSGIMQWSDWTAFQIHDKWTEPGELRRVGDCLIEWAPSGAYVEDWRLQPSGDGPLIGLSLLEEKDKSGHVTHRGGGLVIAGDHAMLVRGRAEALPKAARLSDLVDRASAEPRLLDAILGFEASYARRDEAGRYVVVASTLPWREGQPLMSLEDFQMEDGFLRQKVRELEPGVERRFRIDTLEESYEDWLATSATAQAVDWLAAEESTLLRPARQR
jgi:hypothetical protein